MEPVECRLWGYKYVQTRGSFQIQAEVPMCDDKQTLERLGSPDNEKPPRLAIVRLNEAP